MTAHARQMKQYAIKILADHILVTNSADFQATRGLVFQQWNDIAKACAKSGLKKVLIHGVGFERKLNTAEIFRTGDAFPGLGLLGMRVALCFPGYKTDELSGFFRTVADNRGVELCFFGELEAAAEWLGIASSKQQTTRMTPA